MCNLIIKHIHKGWRSRLSLLTLHHLLIVETVTEGGQRFMAAWRKEQVDAARHRQEKKEATSQGKLVSYTEA